MVIVYPVGMMTTNKTHEAPGKAHREGITVVQLMDMFPTDETATKWFEQMFWNDERCCGHCGSLRTCDASHRKMPYWCSDCRSYFSVRTGTMFESSHVSLRKWAIAIYLEVTSLKSVSSMKLHRDIGVSQPTAWFMLHRIREAWKVPNGNSFGGPVEVDETYFGGKRRNMRASKRKALTGRGPSGKTAVVGMKDRQSNKVRAKVVENTDAPTLQGFVLDNSAPDAKIYTDDAAAYAGLPRDREAVRHSVGEYVRQQAHTNGIESFWATLKRAHKGVFHKMSPKHLQRYVVEFAGKHNVRNEDTLAQMVVVAAGMVGKRLMYRDLIADNGLPSGARGGSRA